MRTQYTSENKGLFGRQKQILCHNIHEICRQLCQLAPYWLDPVEVWALILSVTGYSSVN